MNIKNFFDEFEGFFNEFDHYFKFKPIKIVGETKGKKNGEDNEDLDKGSFSEGSLRLFLDSMITFFTLQKQLEECIQAQNFEGAADFRDRIKSLKESQKQIKELQRSMEQALDKQDYEKAAQIRDEIKNYH